MCAAAAGEGREEPGAGLKQIFINVSLLKETFYVGYFSRINVISILKLFFYKFMKKIFAYGTCLQVA